MDQERIKYIPSNFDDYFLKRLVKKSISDYRNVSENGKVNNNREGSNKRERE